MKLLLSLAPYPWIAPPLQNTELQLSCRKDLRIQACRPRKLVVK
jgi:hypothetical protein